MMRFGKLTKRIVVTFLSASMVLQGAVFNSFAEEIDDGGVGVEATTENTEGTDDAPAVEEVNSTESAAGGVEEVSQPEIVVEDDEVQPDETAENETTEEATTVEMTTTEEETTTVEAIVNPDEKEFAKIVDSIDDSQYLYEEGGLEVFEESPAYASLKEIQGEEDEIALASDTDELREMIYDSISSGASSLEFPSMTYDYYEVRNTYYEVKNANPEFYYITMEDLTYESANEDGTWKYYADSMEFATSAAYDNEAFNFAVAKAMSGISSSMTDLEKAVVLHDYIVLNTQYNKEVANGGTAPTRDVYNTYGVFVNQDAVCNGYALAYQLLLNKAGIDNVFVTNYNHAWNYVMLDGKYYNVDTTWDDPVPNEEGAALHNEMFASDSSFFGKRGHSTQSLRKTHNGSVTTATATDTRYDTFYWENVRAPFCYYNGTWYYIYNDSICSGNILGTSRTVKYNSFGKWYVFGNKAYYTMNLSGLFSYGGKLYFNKIDGVYSIGCTNNTVTKVYSADTSREYLYGCGARYDIANRRMIAFVFPGVEWTDDIRYLSYDSLVGKNTYVVTFFDANGNVLKEQTVSRGGSATAPTAPTIAGYTFTGWSRSFTNVTADISVTAQYKANPYTITYVLNGGTLNTTINSYTSTQSVTLPIPTRTGYKFDGWYTNSSFTGSSVSYISSGSTGNKTFYAKWSVKQPQTPVIAPVSGAAYKTLASGYLVDEGTKIEIKCAAGDEDVTIYYTTDGKDADKTSTKYTAPFTVTNGTKISAIAYRNDLASSRVSKTIAVADNSLVLSSTSIDVNNGEEKIIGIKKVPYGKYNSDVRWTVADPKIATVDSSGYVTGVSAGSTTVTATCTDWQNRTVTATCKVVVVKANCTVVFKGKDGTVLKTQTVKARTAATAPASTAIPKIDGYSFTGWDKSFNYVVEDMVINAVYKPVEYKITYNCNGGKVDSTAKTAYTIESATFVLPTCTGRAGYTFDGWYTDATFTTSAVTRITKGTTGDKTFYAKWNAKKPETPVIEIDGEYVSTEDGTVILVKDSKITIAVTGESDGVSIYYTLDGTEPTKKSTKYTKSITVDKDMELRVVAYRDDVKSDELRQKCLVAEVEFEIDTTSKTIEKGDSFDIKVTKLPTSKTEADVTWKSDDEKVATVSPEGHVEAISVGTTTIHATVTDWRNVKLVLECEVTVEPARFWVTFLGYNGKRVKLDLVDEGKDAKAPEIPLKVLGYTFVKWDVPFTNILEDRTVKAIYKLDEYTISYNAGGGSIPKNEITKYTYESDEITLLDAYGKDGFVFAGWYDNADLTGSPVTVIPANSTGDRTFYAKWRNEKELWMRWKGLDEDASLKVPYTGKAIKPECEVYYGDTLLVAGKDYTLTYKNNTKACTSETDSNRPTLIVTGKGNYTGKVTKNFEIEPKNIESDVTEGKSASDIDVESVAIAYNGRQQKKQPKVTWNGKALGKKDIIVEYHEYGYAAYTEPGVYSVTVTGQGNYCGTVETTIQIVDTKDAQGLMLVSKCKAKIQPFTYTGEDIDFDEVVNQAKVTVMSGKTELVYGTDYTLIYGKEYNGVPCNEVGTYTVIVKGKGRYVGELRTKLTISGTQIKTAKMEPIASVLYDGKAQEPSITLYSKSGILLKEDKDYTVEYANNINAGNAQVIITGIGEYTGTVKKTFKITQLPIQILTGEQFSVTLASGRTKAVYEKGGAKPALTVKCNGQILTEGVDYTVSYKNNNSVYAINGKMPTAVVTGKKNYKGKREVTFSISQADISRAKIELQDVVESDKYGKFMSSPVITDINGKRLAKNVDYEGTIEYRDIAGNKLDKYSKPEVGDIIVVTVRGKNNYKGTLQGTYRICEKGTSIANAKITVKKSSANNLIYNGQPVTLKKSDLEIVLNGQLLDSDDYDIVENSYVNNVNKGTAKVTIRGKGDYAGYKTISFTIKAQNMTWWERLLK